MAADPRRPNLRTSTAPACTDDRCKVRCFHTLRKTQAQISFKENANSSKGRDAQRGGPARTA